MARPAFSGFSFVSRQTDSNAESCLKKQEEEPEDGKKDRDAVDTGALTALAAFAAAGTSGGLGLAALLPLIDHKKKGDCRKEAGDKVMEKIKAYSVADASRGYRCASQSPRILLTLLHIHIKPTVKTTTTA